MNILIIYPHGNALNPHSGAETRIWNLNKVLIENYIAPKFEKMDIIFVLAGFNVLKFKKKKLIFKEH